MFISKLGLRFFIKKSFVKLLDVINFFIFYHLSNFSPFDPQNWRSDSTLPQSFTWEKISVSTHFINKIFVLFFLWLICWKFFFFWIMNGQSLIKTVKWTIVRFIVKQIYVRYILIYSFYSLFCVYTWINWLKKFQYTLIFRNP